MFKRLERQEILNLFPSGESGYYGVIDIILDAQLQSCQKQQDELRPTRLYIDGYKIMYGCGNCGHEGRLYKDQTKCPMCTATLPFITKSEMQPKEPLTPEKVREDAKTYLLKVMDNWSDYVLEEAVMVEPVINIDDALDQILSIVYSQFQLKEGESQTLVKGLARIASNFGSGSFSASPDFKTEQRFRIYASETLEKAGYSYHEYPRVPPDKDGWYTVVELEEIQTKWLATLIK